MRNLVGTDYLDITGPGWNGDTFSIPQYDMELQILWNSAAHPFVSDVKIIVEITLYGTIESYYTGVVRADQIGSSAWEPNENEILFPGETPPGTYTFEIECPGNFEVLRFIYFYVPGEVTSIMIVEDEIFWTNFNGQEETA